MAEMNTDKRSLDENEMTRSSQEDSDEEIMDQTLEGEQDEGRATGNKAEPGHPQVDITPEQDGGVVKQLIVTGEGDETPGFGDRVFINYTAFIHRGSSLKEFDRNLERFQFNVGKGTVIRGLELGVSTMKKNEQSLFIIQPQYGYGELGNPPSIPPYTVLFFIIELFEWRPEDLTFKKDEGVLRKVINKGEGVNSPNDGAVIKAEFIGSYNNEVFESREVEFVLGEGCNFDVPEGIEIALLKFKLHEKSLLYLKAKYAFNSKGKPEYGIPPDADVQYVTTLLSFEKAKDVWEMNSDEKFEKAEESKVKGTAYFVAGNYKVALKQFKKIITYLENEPGVSLDSELPRKTLLIAGYLNATLCMMKLENYIDAIKCCDKALGIAPENEKALYRRGQCRMAISDCEEALDDFKKLSIVNPGNKACANSIISCQVLINKQKEKEKSIYGNMFQKFAEQDEAERKRRRTQTETGVWDSKKHQSRHCNDAIVKMLNIKRS